MKEKSYQVKFLTPCFCKGAYKENPEIRSPSIRGMIREWARMKGENPEDVWGGAGKNASKVGVMVKIDVFSPKDVFLLPHAEGIYETRNGRRIHKASPSKAIPEGTEFELQLTRLVGCTDNLWEKAIRDVETWLLLGCLGQRSNRAAGSVWNIEWDFKSFNDLKMKLKELKIPQNRDIRISKLSFETGEKARETASDTKGGSPNYFGSIHPRKSSPVKMKVVLVNQKYHLLPFAKTRDLLDGAISELKKKSDNSRWENLFFEKLQS